MAESRLLYLSINQLVNLYDNVDENIDRYRNEGFQDLSSGHGWSIPAEVSVDYDLLEGLVEETGKEHEINNSLLVWRALHAMSPALATENRVWTHISHTHGFNYSKGRWLNLKGDDASLAKQIRDHFFAPSLTRYRDDHAIGRLWWNAYVAKLLQPEDQEGALRLILSAADIRSNLIERPMTFARLEIGKALLRAMSRTPETHASQKAFREFMKQVNKYGGGLVFEALDQDECDRFMATCWERAEPLIA
jgi:hypothetical protein